MNDIQAQSHGFQTGSDERQADELAGGAAAGEERQQRNGDPADDDRIGVDAGERVQHGLESGGGGDDRAEAGHGADAHGHGNGFRRGLAEQALQILPVQLLPKQPDRENVADHQTGDDVQLQQVERQEQQHHRDQGEPEIRLGHVRRRLGVQRMALEMLAVFPGAVDHKVHEDQNRRNFNRNTHQTRDQGHVRGSPQRRHGRHIAHLRAAGHGLRKGERTGCQDA